jgi:hypothetical protein
MGLGFSLLGFGRIDTIARKPEHDKATGHMGTMAALNRAVRSAIVLIW